MSTELREALSQLEAAAADMLAGWKYIRSFHGDLYGVGWDRAQGKVEAAMARCAALPPSESAAVAGDVAWLWTHCRAIGMTRRSDSRLMRDDVALFTIDQRTEIDRLNDAVRSARADEAHCWAGRVDELTARLKAVADGVAAPQPAQAAPAAQPEQEAAKAEPVAPSELEKLLDAYVAAHCDWFATGHASAQAYAALARSNLLDAMLSASPPAQQAPEDLSARILALKRMPEANNNDNAIWNAALRAAAALAQPDAQREG